MTLDKLMHPSVRAVVRSWAETKLSLERSLPFDSDWLHLILGPMVIVVAAQIMRKPIRSWWPWSAVFAVVAINEFIDLYVDQWPDWEMQYAESAADILLTLVLPTLMLVVARCFPRAGRAGQ